MDKAAVESLIKTVGDLLDGDLALRFGEPKDAFEQSALDYVSQAKVNLGKARDILNNVRPAY